MEEKLKRKKFLLKLLGFALVTICVVVVFIPLFSMTKTVEMYGIKETITIRFSAWQMLVQEEKIALESTSALGEFQGFATISMQELLGGEKMALFTTGALIALAVPFVFYAIGMLFLCLVDCLQRGTMKYFLISFLLFLAFPIFVQSVIEGDYIMSPPIIPILVIAVVGLVSTSLFDTLMSGISVISAEIFIRKYKNENKKWFDAFLTDFEQYMDNANIPVDMEGFVRFVDAQDRKELREQIDENN
ncbi:MAG: hypothetical protein E7372_02030 [Clostridiales bacterium]|nr:hypothetical protein [Clostridiales bacterium]